MHKFDITYEDAEPTLETIEFAVQSGNITRALKEQLGAARMLKTFEDASGAQIYVLDYEHIARVHIVPPVPTEEPSAQEEPIESREEVGVIDYVSGAVLGSVIKPEALQLPTDDPEKDPPVRPLISNLRITERTAERIPADFARHKLAVVEDGAFAPLRSNDLNIYSQHASINPGLYTGAMRALVQVLLGVGIAHPYTYESRWIGEQGKRFLNSDDFQGDTGAMPRSGFGLFHNMNPMHEVKVLYDYRWNRTHGVAWGEDGAAYIVEVGQRGVLVMPLPVDPISTTALGRERYEQLFPELFDAGLFPEQGKSFFDLFGGFPTGAPMPRGSEQLDQWVRAGEVVEAIDASGMGDVYSNIPYATGMGWAFNPNGSEAHNTCYGYDGRGFKVGRHYAVTIRIGAVAPREPVAAAAEVVAKLGLSGVDSKKARRMDQAQAEGILAIDDAGAAKEAFDALTVTPDVQVQARVREQKKGCLYNPGKLVPGSGTTYYPGVIHPLVPGIGITTGGGGGGIGWSGQPQIKFPEPMLGNPLLSFDFGGPDGTDPATAPRCDTPMFVCFRGSDLVVVNYAWHYQLPGPREEFDDRQPCQLEGTWKQGHNAEGARAHGHFYSTDVDWREEIHTAGGYLSTTTVEYVGKTAFLSFCAFFAMHSISFWEYWYMRSSTWRSSGSKSRKISVAIPANDRSIYMIAKLDSENDVSSGGSSNHVFMGTTGSARAPGVIYEFVMHWNSVCRDPERHESGGQLRCELREAGEPYQVPSCIEDEITVKDTPYAPCVDRVFALSKRYGDIPSGDAQNWNDPNSRSVAHEIRLYGDTHISGRVTSKESKEGKDPAGAGGLVDFYSLGMSSWWWKPSPTKEGHMAYLQTLVNAFGTPLHGYEPDFDALNAEYAGEPASMHVYLGACFVGWVA